MNPNRNAFLSRGEIEAKLKADLGLDRVLWLGSGLMNDHTDGHVDNLARFVGAGRIAVPEPAASDPNEAVYRDAAIRARRFGLEVVPMPSAGCVLRGEEIIPASYMNFYIGNAAVIVPQYGAANDADAVAAVQALFPGREAIGLRADHILTGGGSFHCISQQMPA
jgi:agmatine deiminase